MVNQPSSLIKQINTRNCKGNEEKSMWRDFINNLKKYIGPTSNIKSSPNFVAPVFLMI